ncbi:MAG: hypothetical protein KJ731_15770 [Alphaproteobacteria bacterium]|uniref:Uncharacterized protein n=1 Tax=viral metagenome TaxID=1070528 RepID=A0A6M3JLE0_9ZZZZ|nr:hypothetical protein [Alphaproteobacteria bacterium]MBU1277648.1 hypothetical protein [Alphaproteobacteria bacterium]MBU1574517.1 hypothetical protein [Alphaproteobacteria bacterium]MBU1829909.1 hypothetical protein [Alphaproteobacteria bacterium]MBU2079947.1 hypothetical protein [Alphaproteobacteria bacterium]
MSDLVKTTSGFVGTREQMINALQCVQQRGGTQGAVAGAAADEIERLTQRAEQAECRERSLLDTTAELRALRMAHNAQGRSLKQAEARVAELEEERKDSMRNALYGALFV